MRHLGRTHGLSISWLKERFDSKYYEVEYCKSNQMCADIFTKPFDNKEKWDQAKQLINIFDINTLDITSTMRSLNDELLVRHKDGNIERDEAEAAAVCLEPYTSDPPPLQVTGGPGKICSIRRG